MSATTSTPATGKPPRRAKRRLLALGVVTLAAGAGLAGLAAPAAFAGVNGGVDLNAACATQNGIPGAYATFPTPGNVYDWYCVAPQGWDLGGINIDEQCAVQYGPGSEASYSDYWNPYSWYCYSN